MVLFVFATNGNTKPLDSEMPENYLPELAKVLKELPQKSSLLEEEHLRVEESSGLSKIAHSASGFKLSVNLQGQSIHEDRPNQEFYHRYRFLGSASLRKPIFHWGALQAEREIGKTEEIRASFRFRNLERRLESQVRTHYQDLIVSKYEIQLAEETLSIAKQNQEDLIKREELGLITSLSVDEAVAIRIKQEILLSNLKNQFSMQSNLFDDFIDSDQNLTFERTSSFLDFCNNHKFANNLPVFVSSISFHEIEELKMEVENEKRRILIAESELKPKFNLIGGIYQDQVALADNRENLTRNNLLVGVEANWAIWDSEKSKGKKEVALAKKRRHELTIERLSRSLRIEMETLRASLVSAGRNIEMNRKLVKVAENRYEKSMIEFELNRITPISHFETRTSLDRSRLNLLLAVMNYQKTKDQYLTRISFQGRN